MNTEMVYARDIRTGDLLQTGTGERVVSHAATTGDTVTLHHGPRSYTEMAASTRCRIRSRTRRVEVHEADADESQGGHIWSAVSM